MLRCTCDNKSAVAKILAYVGQVGWRFGGDEWGIAQLECSEGKSNTSGGEACWFCGWEIFLS